MAITALAVALAPPAQEGVDIPSGAGSAHSGNAPGLDAGVVARTVSADAVEAPTLEVSVGSILRLTVEADTLDSVQIEGLDLFSGVAPESPALFEVLADRVGTYPVRLVEADRLVAQIDVSSQR